VLDADLVMQRVGVEKPKCGGHLDVGGQRNPAFLDQKQLIFPDLLGPQLVRRFAKVFGELCDLQNVRPDRGGGVVANLEILQHSLP
jgi:hypothetical protein